MKTFREYASILDVTGSTSSNLAFISAHRQRNKDLINRTNDRQLAVDIENAGYRYVRATGQAIETDKNGQKAVVKEKSYLVVAGASTPESFRETIIHWLNKYGQEYALIRFSHSDKAWKLYPTGNQFDFGSWEKDVVSKYR